MNRPSHLDAAQGKCETGGESCQRRNNRALQHSTSISAAKNGSGHRSHRGDSGGYTIVETMIFLVVTAALFVSAVGLFNGQNRRTQFTQGVRELDSSIQDAYNEIASGYYPNNGNFSCTSSGSGPSLSKTNSALGTNTNCIFLGKVFQFSPKLESNCQDSDNYTCYNLYTVVGQRLSASGSGTQDVVSLAEAKPTPVVPTSSSPDNPDLTRYSSIPGGLRAYAVIAYKSGVATPVGGFGFINSFANNSSNSQLSGAQSVDLLPIYNNSSLDQTVDGFVPKVSAMSDANRNPDRVIICLADGTGSGARKAAITIGGSTSGASRKFTTDVSIDKVPGDCQSITP